ncbi:MAG: hypothetical protein HYS55_04195 [Candidatus Omnitrophica bacterium]|nr:hypothetical protein [Candidatus Omnitrophota bacterium]
MNHKHKFISGFVFALVLSVLLNAGPLFGFGEAVEGSSEALFWTSPQTVHDFQKATDIHGIATSAMAITELEVVRLVDRAINFPIRKNLNLLEKMFGLAHDSYQKIPQIKPVRRAGQLVDALLIEELSLADLRTIINAASSQGGGGITPMMQARLYRILVWGERVMDDLDQALLLPMELTLSQIAARDVQIKFLGYGGDGLGLAREQLFMVLRIVNKKLVKLGSKVIDRMEDIQNAWIRYQKTKKNKHFFIHLRIPLSEYETNPALLKNKYSLVTKETNGVRMDRATSESGRELLTLIQIDRPAFAADTEYMLVSVQANRWNNASPEMRRYVIDEDEYRQFHAVSFLDRAAES